MIVTNETEATETSQCVVKERTVSGSGFRLGRNVRRGECLWGYCLLFVTFAPWCRVGIFISGTIVLQ